MQAVGERLEHLFHQLLAPIRVPLEMLGFRPSDFGIYLFFVALFLLYLAWRTTGGPWVFDPGRRGVATGTVIDIDRRGDSPTPLIRFRDGTGREWTFDSDLPANATTGVIGANVAVLYDTANPRFAREEGRPLHKLMITVFLLGFAAMLFVVSLGGYAAKPG